MLGSFKHLSLLLIKTVINPDTERRIIVIINESVKIHDLLFVKLHLLEFFDKKVKGEIFVYNNHKYDILFTNDYTYLGRDSFRNNSIWKLI